MLLRLADRLQVAGEDPVAVDQQLDVVAPRDRRAGERLGGAQERARSGRRARRAGRSRGRSRAGGAASPRRTRRGPPRRPRRARRTRATRRRRDAGDDRRRPIDHRRGLDDVLVEPELLRLQPEREADQLRQVQHRHAERAADDLLGQRLLEVEVEVAQRARRDEAVGVGVDRVAEVAAGLLERALLVHRDDREAAALVLARVVDDRAAERLDQLLQVGVARVLARRSPAGRSGGRCSSRRTGRRAGR